MAFRGMMGHHKDKESRRRSRSPAPKKNKERRDTDDRHTRRGSSKDQRDDATREAEAARRRLEKEAMKAGESMAEKRLRRLAKKVAKDAKREAAGVTVEAYSNTLNPFGDVNLKDKFTWHKKIEAAEDQGMSRRRLAEIERQQRRENLEEIVRVKKQRAEREAEFEAREAEKDSEARAKDDEQFEAWVAMEEDFHVNQARLRSQIRMREGRGTPIDHLAQYIHQPEDEPLDVQGPYIHEPYTVFQGLSLAATEVLLGEIVAMGRLEGGTANGEYWERLEIICRSELEARTREKKRARKNLPAAERRALESGINDAVKDDILRVFAGKSYTQLVEMQAQIEERVAAEGAVDAGYWATLLQELAVQKAKAILRHQHQQHLERQLRALREGGGGGAPQAVRDAEQAAGDVGAPQSGGEVAEGDEATEGGEEWSWSRPCSPELVPADAPTGGELLAEAEAAQRLDEQRRRVLAMLAAGMLAAAAPGKRALEGGGQALSAREREFMAIASRVRLLGPACHLARPYVCPELRTLLGTPPPPPPLLPLPPNPPFSSGIPIFLVAFPSYLPRSLKKFWAYRHPWYRVERGRTRERRRRTLLCKWTWSARTMICFGAISTSRVSRAFSTASSLATSGTGTTAHTMITTIRHPRWCRDTSSTFSTQTCWTRQNRPSSR